MPVICRVRARSTGESGLMAAVNAETQRTNPYPTVDDPDPEPQFLLRVVATADAQPFETLFARESRVQQVGLRLYKGGYWDGAQIVSGVRCDNDIDGWQLQHGIDEPIGTASCGVPLDHLGRSPFGSGLMLGAPPPGLLAVHWTLAFKTQGAAQAGKSRLEEYPLMLYSLADTGPRQVGPPSSDQLAFRSNLARYVDTRMTYRLPAGHGFTYIGSIGALCAYFSRGFFEVPGLPQYVLNAATGRRGVPSALAPLAGDFPLRKPIELAKGDWLSLGRAIGNTVGAKLFDNEIGELSAAYVTPELGPPGYVDGVITERDIVRAVNGQRIAMCQITPSTGGPTKVNVTGNKQVTKDSGSDRETLVLPFESRSSNPLQVCASFQHGDGSVTDTGIVASAEDRIVSQGVTTIEKVGQTVLSSVTESRALTNPTKARYQLDVDLSILNYIPVYVDDASNGSQARVFPTAILIDANKSSFSRTFDSFGFLTNTLKESWGYKHRRAYLQRRSDRTVSWEDLSGAPGVFGRYSLGGGEGVATLQAEFLLTELVTEDIANTADGFVAEKTTRTFGYKLRPGFGETYEYRYGDGTTSRDPEETFVLLSEKYERWQKIDKFTHAYHMRERDGDGNEIDGDDDVLEGQPPPADKLENTAPKRSDFQTDAEFAQAVAASHFDQQAMSATVSGPASVRIFKEIDYSDSWAQTQEQLQRIGQRLILVPQTVTWTMLPNPLVKRGRWWHVRCRQPGADLDHDCLISSRQFSQQGPGGAILMQVTALTWD